MPVAGPQKDNLAQVGKQVRLMRRQVDDTDLMSNYQRLVSTGFAFRGESASGVGRSAVLLKIGLDAAPGPTVGTVTAQMRAWLRLARDSSSTLIVYRLPKTIRGAGAKSALVYRRIRKPIALAVFEGVAVVIGVEAGVGVPRESKCKWRTCS